MLDRIPLAGKATDIDVPSRATTRVKIVRANKMMVGSFSS
jgi:hypothetical protein